MNDQPLDELSAKRYQKNFDTLRNLDGDGSMGITWVKHVGLFRIAGNGRLGLGIVDLRDGSTVIVDKEEAKEIKAAIIGTFGI